MVVVADLFLDHLTGHVIASARPVSLGPDADVVALNGVTTSSADPELWDRPEIHLEDVVLEIRRANVPVVVGLDAVVYLHPGASVHHIEPGGTVYLADGADVEELDELALASGEITTARWQMEIQQSKEAG